MGHVRRPILVLALASLSTVLALAGPGWLAILPLVLLTFVLYKATEPDALVEQPPPAPAVAPPSDPSKALVPVLNGLSFPVILLDEQGIMIVANRAARMAFPGCRPDLPVSAGLRSPDLLAALREVAEGGGERRVEFTERVPVERSYAVAIRRLDGAEVPPARLLLHAIETTEQRRVETMRVDFIANASHELRTPLASLLGFVETLQGPARNDTQARDRFLGIMRQQAERMRRLIDDLLSLSRIEMRAHVPPSDEIDLAMIVPQLVDSLTAFAAEKGVAVELTGFEDGPAWVTGDRDELFRAFENLIENAIKYGASGERVKVTLQRDPGRGEWRVDVQDFGPGIAAHHLPRLTERFYRADVQESRALGGTGLGLALVKHIVSRHRGRLLIESREGEGAVFAIALPQFQPSEK